MSTANAHATMDIHQPAKDARNVMQVLLVEHAQVDAQLARTNWYGTDISASSIGSRATAEQWVTGMALRVPNGHIR